MLPVPLVLDICDITPYLCLATQNHSPHCHLAMIRNWWPMSLRVSPIPLCSSTSISSLATIVIPSHRSSHAVVTRLEFPSQPRHRFWLGERPISSSIPGSSKLRTRCPMRSRWCRFRLLAPVLEMWPLISPFGGFSRAPACRIWIYEPLHWLKSTFFTQFCRANMLFEVVLVKIPSCSRVLRPK